MNNRPRIALNDLNEKRFSLIYGKNINSTDETGNDYRASEVHYEKKVDFSLEQLIL